MSADTASVWMLYGRNYARLVKPQQSGSSRSIPLPMLMDGPYSIVEVSSGGRRRNDKVHLPQYVSGEELESLVQGEVGGRIEEGPEDGQAPTVWEKQSQEVLKGLPEVQTISQGLIEDPEDFWFDVHWTETSSDKAKAGQKAGCWWETDDC